MKKFKPIFTKNLNLAEDLKWKIDEIPKLNEKEKEVLTACIFEFQKQREDNNLPPNSYFDVSRLRDDFGPGVSEIISRLAEVMVKLSSEDGETVTSFPLFTGFRGKHDDGKIEIKMNDLILTKIENN